MVMQMIVVAVAALAPDADVVDGNVMDARQMQLRH